MLKRSDFSCDSSLFLKISDCHFPNIDANTVCTAESTQPASVECTELVLMNTSSLNDCVPTGLKGRKPQHTDLG